MLSGEGATFDGESTGGRAVARRSAGVAARARAPGSRRGAGARRRRCRTPRCRTIDDGGGTAPKSSFGASPRRRLLRRREADDGGLPRASATAVRAPARRAPRFDGAVTAGMRGFESGSSRGIGRARRPPHGEHVRQAAAACRSCRERAGDADVSSAGRTSARPARAPSRRRARSAPSSDRGSAARAPRPRDDRSPR